MLDKPKGEEWDGGVGYIDEKVLQHSISWMACSLTIEAIIGTSNSNCIRSQHQP